MEINYGDMMYLLIIDITGALIYQLSCATKFVFFHFCILLFFIQGFGVSKVLR